MRLNIIINIKLYNKNIKPLLNIKNFWFIIKV
nr:MAG TPA: hypothetical protein [Caudoviricetes sp.]